MKLDCGDFFNNLKNIFGFIFNINPKNSYILESLFFFEKQGSFAFSLNIRQF